MKYSIDTYQLYKDETFAPFSIRAKVTMKEPVDIDILKKSVQTAMTRYPYLDVKPVLDEDGSYYLVPNDKEVLVINTPKKPLGLGSPEINDHLLYVDCSGCDIFFNISHALCGGKGSFPWIMTNVYQYVKDRFGTDPLCPEIRKPGSELFDDECVQPDRSMLSNEKPLCARFGSKPAQLTRDYMNGIFNPFASYPNYTVFRFDQKDIISFTKGNDASVTSFFMVVTARALAKVLPEKENIIGIETAHNPMEKLGIKNCHSDFLSHLIVNYDRDKLKWDMEKLNTMTRGQIVLKTDLSVSSEELRHNLDLYEGIDNIKGLKNKKSYMKSHNLSTGKDAFHGTSIVNYTGHLDWGEVADYIDSFSVAVGGHMLIEITSLGDKIFVSVMQLLKQDKYINAIKAVMDELGIAYGVEGPFPKNQPKHKLPGA